MHTRTTMWLRVSVASLAGYCVELHSGEVRCWGANDVGQVGELGLTLVAVRVDGHALGVGAGLLVGSQRGDGAAGDGHRAHRAVVGDPVDVGRVDGDAAAPELL